MLSVNTGFFLRAPTEGNKRELCRATVAGVQDDAIVATLDKLDHEIAAHQELLIYFVQNNRFLQQSIRLRAVTRKIGRVTIAFEMIGDPISAESRQCFRVSTALAGIVAKLDEEDDCEVRDISMTGFSALATTVWRIGVSMPVSIRYQEEIYSGTAVVQSVRGVDDGRYRYGFHCPSKAGGKNQLADGLRTISMAVQRAQLRRQSGAA